MARVGKTIALAHYFDNLIEEGYIENRSAIAAHLGISRARLSQIMLLLSISPNIVTRILQGGLSVSERRLRPIALEPSWKKQQLMLQDMEK